jgi:hypothetical protein
MKATQLGYHFFLVAVNKKKRKKPISDKNTPSPNHAEREFGGMALFRINQSI